MTPTELASLRAAFRQELEDIISAVNRRFYLNDGSVYPDEGRPEVTGVAWTDEAEVLSVIPVGSRTDYLTVNIAGVEYWFIGGILVNKVGSLSLTNNSVTLAKLADVATGMILYRKTAGTGDPEYQTLATLAADLGLTDLISTVGDKVDKVTDYSLVLNTLIAQIHAPGSDNQDLSGLVEKVTGSGLITDTEKARLASLGSTVYTLLLPASVTVAGRVSDSTIPSGWTITADSSVNLLVTHTLTGRKVAAVNVFEIDGTNERLSVPFQTAYSGVLGNGLTVLIEGLNPSILGLRVEIIFA